MAFLVGVKLMKWLSKAPSGFVPRVGGLAIYISIFTHTASVFGFIPLSVMFDLDAEQLALLILSAAPSLPSDLLRTWGMRCRSRLD